MTWFGRENESFEQRNHHQVSLNSELFDLSLSKYIAISAIPILPFLKSFASMHCSNRTHGPSSMT
jgi:hypothetical protein